MAILKPVVTSSGEEDSLSSPGTEDESRCTEVAQAAEEPVGSGSESDGEASVRTNKTVLRRWRESMPTRDLEQGSRTARSFPTYEGSGDVYRETELGGKGG